MSYSFSFLPKDIKSIISLDMLINILSPLVGTKFVLTGKTRTDGSNIRKAVQYQVGTYLEKLVGYDYNLDGDGEILFDKGLPRFLNQLIDTYIVTNADSNYNLQVWNRKPTGNYPIAILSDGAKITPKDIRIILVCVENNIIKNITIYMPEFIEQHYGKFGKPTIKHQALISSGLRKEIRNAGGILVGQDTSSIKRISTDDVPNFKGKDLKSYPDPGQVISIPTLQKIIWQKIKGYNFGLNVQTKNKGQELEQMIADMLGYKNSALLEGLYPDLRHQWLEVKVQDSPTIDMGKYSPLFDESLDEYNDLYIKDVRYLIVLTEGSIVSGMILLSGVDLEKHLTYVSDTSFKCQRSLPKQIFSRNKDQRILVNPLFNQ